FPNYSGNFTDYTSDIDGYFNDRFAARRFAIKAERKIRGFWENVEHSVYHGKEGWLFWSEPSIWESYQGRSGFTLQTRKDFESVIEALKVRSDASGAAFAATIVPNKSTIYPEYAPKRFGEKSPRNFLDYVMTRSDEAKLHLVNLKLLLLEQKSTSKLYYKTDTHWTSQGAFIAYKAMMTRLQRNNSEFEILENNDVTFRAPVDFQGDLGRLSNSPVSETDRRLKPTDLGKFKVEKLEDDTVIDVYKTLIYRRETPRKYDGRTIVVIGDSFSLRYVDFFKAHFDRVIIMHHRLGDFDIDDVFAHDPDAVIFSPVERYSEQLANTYNP
ncbi:MAG: DHHW family protein, partial [Litorimonas sp.]